MEKFYQKVDGMVQKFDLIFKLLLITVGFLHASSLTFGRPIISWVQWPMFLLGAVLVLYRLLFFKKYLSSRGIVFLVLFAFSYAISSIYTLQYGIHENLRFLAFMVLQFGLLYAFDSARDPEQNRRQLRSCMQYYLLLCGLLSAASFVFMSLNFVRTYAPEAGAEGPVYYIGFIHGRLFGAYWDPNIAATMAAVAVLISVFFLIREKRLFCRILYGVNIILQISYITFSDSRTGKMCLIAGTVLVTLLLAVKYFPVKQKFLRTISIVLLISLTAGVAYAIPWGIRTGYNFAVSQTAPFVPQPGIDPVIPPEEDDSIGRGEDLIADPSNRRFDIWKSAVEVFRTSPVLGVSRGNILRYVDEHLPDSYLVQNDHMRFESMHNLFFEILVSQGLLGIILFLLFAIWSVWGILRSWKVLWNSENYVFYVLIISILGVVCCSSLVMMEIVYVTSPISSLFWLSLGCLNQSLAAESKKSQFLSE